MAPQICKFCFFVFGAEGTRKNCHENLDADPPAHEWYELEEVSDEQKLLTPESCKKCPDAKFYNNGNRPFMKEKGGASKTCRNAECSMFKVTEVKPEGKSGHAKRPRNSITRRTKMPASATDMEKRAIRVSRDTVAELEAQLEIEKTKLRLILAALGEDVEAEGEAGDEDDQQ